MIDVAELEKKVPILKDIQNEKEVFWINPDKTNCEEASLKQRSRGYPRKCI